MTTEMAIEDHFESVVTVGPADEERANHIISEEHASAAVAAMPRGGITVLANAIELSILDTLDRILTEQAGTLPTLSTTLFTNASYLHSSFKAQDKVWFWKDFTGTVKQAGSLFKPTLVTTDHMIARIGRVVRDVRDIQHSKSQDVHYVGPW
ncbi:hypothetical protein BDW68DRAFT_15280 [Aspergillus falconensis]